MRGEATNPSGLEKCRLKSSVVDITSFGLWRGVVAEFVATTLFLFIGCSSTIAVAGQAVTLVRIGLCFGLAIAALVWIFGDASGGHINPAVTLSMLLTRRISLVRAVLYIMAQCCGAIAGVAILQDCANIDNKDFCVNKLLSGVEAGQGTTIEFLASTLLIFTIFAACDQARRDTGGSGALAIGLAVAVCHFAFIPLTGASMNPARSFGPAVMAGNFVQHWVYWVGPCLGSVVAGYTYEFLFCGNASLRKVYGLIVEWDYNPDGDSAITTVSAENQNFRSPVQQSENM